MRRATLVFVAATLCMIAGAQAQPGDPSAAARTFVQQFYGWYVPLITSPKGAPEWDIVLTKAQQNLDPGLYRALKADDDAQKKVPGEVVGLDFDPFLNSQDPGTRYTVGKITASHGGFLVEVRDAGMKSKEPDVIANVARQDGRWVFVDFLYPGNGDLLGVLRNLAKDRATPSK
jgi:Protein of unknown function (DUF3828)